MALTPSLAMYIALSASFYTAAAANLKSFADTNSMKAFAISMALYFIGNLLFVQIIKQGLAIGYVLSSMASLIGAVMIGFLQGEVFSIQRGVAIVLAVMAAVLISLPPTAEV